MPFTPNPDEIEVSPEDTATALADGSAQVVDCREQYEWDEGRIDGRIHIPMDRVSSQRPLLATDRPVIFHGRLGGRSMMAAQAYRAAGYEAYSMAGGIQLWDDQRRPLIPQGGTGGGH